MIFWLNSIILLVLLVLVYQDFKHRAIDWYLFIILPVVIILAHNRRLEIMFFDFLINFIFISCNALILWGYFSLKNRKTVNPLNKYIGTGDLLFFISVALMFSPFNFILFFTISMLISLIFYYVLFKTRQKSFGTEIPLAGFISVLLIILIAFNFMMNIDLHSDQWIINQLIF